MQFYANKNRLPLKTFLFFILVLFIAYLPVSSFLFFLKNDAFTGYFPPKFFMSESIHAGHLPLWNPYINFGIPQYGDMSSGYWSPVTWLIASTVGYNAYTFTLEVLLYILIGGIGMYQLTSYLQLHKQVCMMAAIAFMCCGYNAGHLQHFNWLSGAAFLPWCFWSYGLLLNNTSFKNSVRTALVFYLLVASAHPGISISAFYFFAAYFIFHLFENKHQLPLGERIRTAGISHAIFIGLFLLLSAGMITAYLDIMPHFARGEKLSLADALLNPTTPQSWISVLLPFATVKNEAFFNTDISMRNSYFSLALLLFFLFSLYGKKNKLQVFLLCAGIFFTLLSAGGIFKTIAYKFIPFTGYVRLNGEFRIIAVLCFIIIAAIQLNQYITQRKSFSGFIKLIYYTVEVLVIAAILFGLYKSVSTKESVFYNIGNIHSRAGLSAKLKSLIDAISFYDSIWIQGLIQLLLLWGIKWCLRFSNWSLLMKMVAADMILACLLNIPFTGVGKASVAQVQQVLNQSPKGIPVPALIPINSIDTISTAAKNMVGDWSFYNKQPGTKSEVAYPIVLKNMAAYFEQDNPASKNCYTNKAFIFVDDTLQSKLIVQSFSPQQIQLYVESNAAGNLVLQQNFYPHWYYINGAVKKEVTGYGINFMSAPITTGNNNISFVFEPGKVKWAMVISLITLVSFCVLVFLPGKDSRGK
ncbi:MAG: hypothetical protein IPP72_14145 [Chitinophagaceae bacterium]|nr:hypothetical protein [Chitinophagaceae bacterium]